MDLLEIILFVALFFLIAVLWINSKIQSKKIDTSLKWLAHIELLLKEKGIWEVKFDDNKTIKK
jgi:hypothetical protein